ncbi:MAG: EamA family transporter [Gammaproteobacteria bacterium]
MQPRHIVLAIILAAVWGCNFLFIKFSLIELPPFLLCAARFLLASFPAILFIKRPSLPALRLITLYGLVMFATQFSLLFFGMRAGASPGIAALLLQVQIFFSIFFAMAFLKEKLDRWQVLGALISFSGIGLIGLHLGGELTWQGFMLVIGAAATWGLGNLISKKIKNIDVLALVVWGSFMAFLPLLILSLVFEGTGSLFTHAPHFAGLTIISVGYIVAASTWFGYGTWNALLSRYPISVISPFTFLIPLFGMLCSYLVLGESMQMWKIMAALLIVSGLCVNLLGPRLFVRKVTPILEV